MEKSVMDEGEWPLLVSEEWAVENCRGHAGEGAGLGPASAPHGHSRLAGTGTRRDPTAIHRYKPQVGVGGTDAQDPRATPHQLNVDTQTRITHCRRVLTELGGTSRP